VDEHVVGTAAEVGRLGTARDGGAEAVASKPIAEPVTVYRDDQDVGADGVAACGLDAKSRLGALHHQKVFLAR
jgi:hypothetical protein